MRNPSTSNQNISELSLQQYQIRSHAKLCIGLIILVQLILRLCTALFDPRLTSTSKLLVQITLGFNFMICLVVAAEYYFFRNRGPAIIKYSKVVDLLILLLFMADWILMVVSAVYKVQQTDPPSFKIGSLYGFTSFSWRTLLLTLLAQKWQIKMVAPIAVFALVIGYAIHYDPGDWVFLLLRGLGQVFSIILLVYFEDKMKWRIMWTSLKQEKWMEVNNFILNNIPENIMILNFKGEAKFVSDYCQDFMKKCCVSLQNKDLFKKIQSLQQQQQAEVPLSNSHDNLQIERLTTCNGLLIDADENEPRSSSLDKPTKALEDIVVNFRDIINQKNLQERQFLAYDGKLMVRNGIQKSIEVKISFVHNAEEDHIILILRDMTQRDYLVTLEETNKYKDQLLASVSHELRAPLNGTINLIQGAVNSPKVLESIKETLLTPALHSSKILLHIINDIIDMSQIKQKKFRLVFQSGDLKETLKSTAQLIELQAQKKGLEFQVELDPNIPNHFCTDHIRLSQIVLNLLSNAVKFTTKGTIRLSATRIDESPWIKITIQDSGIGITPRKMNNLSSTTSDGMGLGLSVASNLASMLAPKGHQELSAESIPNTGSIFSFIIEDKENTHLEIHHPESKSSDSSGVAEELAEPMLATPSPLVSSVKPCLCPQVLLVDDNPFNIMALETILGSLEIKSDSVYSGPAAIQKLLDRQAKKCANGDCQQYQMIFMDQEMPEMSGAETVREIRRLQNDNTISSVMRIIGCTAHKAKEEVDLFFEAGLDDCIFKPVSIAMIKDIFNRDMI